MSWRNSKQIVVDANLTYASGNLKFNPLIDPAIASIPDRNRQSLQALFEERHFAVFGRKLYEEWSRHAKEGTHARDWLNRMMKKGRIMLEDGESFANLAGSACACLSADGEKEALAKDFHLIQSALATGQLILSNETHFPRYVSLACPTDQELSTLYYANPAVEGDDCRLWIKAGAEKDADRRIDVWAENHSKSD
jgi:hypothetical protein